MPPPAQPVAGSKRFCGNCGKEVAVEAVACTGCGLPPDAESRFCPSCGSPTADPRQVVCVKCGCELRPRTRPGDKGKVAAGLLGIFLGGLGIHKFYLGYSKEGAIMLAIALVGSAVTAGLAGLAMAVIGFIEGILYLTKSDDEFARTYLRARRPWF